MIVQGGVKTEDVSEALWEQLQKGAQPLDPIVLKLWVRDPNDPVTYSKLLKTIQEKEALIGAKAKNA